MEIMLMGNYSPARNVRIKSLTPGAKVQLRFGKAAVRSSDDTIVEAVLIKGYKDGDKFVVDFQEQDGDGKPSVTSVSSYPGAAWRSGSQYVSLVGVDESTHKIHKAPSPLQTDALSVAAKFVDLERPDVFAATELIALFKGTATIKRVPNDIKDLVLNLAVALTNELSALPPRESREQ